MVVAPACHKRLSLSVGAMGVPVLEAYGVEGDKPSELIRRLLEVRAYSTRAPKVAEPPRRKTDEIHLPPRIRGRWVKPLVWTIERVERRRKLGRCQAR
nr:hypothetical protein GCM10010200_042660 [Actinomadura rugatobispora]